MLYPHVCPVDFLVIESSCARGMIIIDTYVLFHFDDDDDDDDAQHQRSDMIICIASSSCIMTV